VPPSIRRRLRSYIRGVEQERRAAESRAIPYCELEPKHLRHAVLLANREELLKALPKGGVVAEVGVDEGDFSARILAVANPAKLHLIDVWDSGRYHEGKARKVAERFASELARGAVVIQRGYSTDVLPQFADGTFDWIYIDSDHGYKVTAQELALARTKVKAGGLIAGHDYVTGNYEKGVRYGVVEAVAEFCVRHDWEIRFLTNETHQHRSFAIREIGAAS